MSASARTIVRYLLGELSDSAQAALEARYFADPHLFDQVVKTENELVDAYARGRLSKRTRARFERSYLADPRRRERVKFAETLTSRLDRIEGPRVAVRGRPAFVGWAMAAVLVLVAAAGVRWFTESRRVRQHVTQAEPPPALEPRPQPPTPGASPPPEPATAPAFATLLLTASDVRSADPVSPITLTVPPGTEQVRLQLALKEDDYPGYEITLRAVAGPDIVSRQRLRPGATPTGPVFVLTVPAREMATGDYILTLKGVRRNGEVDDLSTSIFHVDHAAPR